MIIRDSRISMLSQRTYSERVTRRESIRAWAAPRPAAPPRATAAASTRVSGPAGEEDDEDEVEVGLDSRTRLIRLVVERMMGIKVKVLKLHKVLQPKPLPLPARAEGAAPTQGWGLQYDLEVTRQEAEDTAFGAQGTIVTADGREIGFEIELRMSRAHTSRQSTSLRLGDAALVDPLVINLDGTPAELSGGKLLFDLDSDGRGESISFVSQGSGFLVLDRNGDGKVNDGSELFGPATGDGFGELAALDGDGNDWIDEADAVSRRLRVWTRDAAGRDRLQTLQQAGVAAIYLGRVETKFDLRDARNQTDGQVASTGIYLGADGAVSTIQQVNLSV